MSSAIEAFGWSRIQAAWLCGAAITALGAFAAFDIDVLDVSDQFANNILLLGGGFALCLFVGWVMPDPMSEVQAGSGPVRWFFAWLFLLRFVVPLFLGFVLWQAVPATFVALAGLFGGGG